MLRPKQLVAVATCSNPHQPIGAYGFDGGDCDDGDGGGGGRCRRDSGCDGASVAADHLDAVGDGAGGCDDDDELLTSAMDTDQFECSSASHAQESLCSAIAPATGAADFRSYAVSDVWPMRRKRQKIWTHWLPCLCLRLLLVCFGSVALLMYRLPLGAVGCLACCWTHSFVAVGVVVAAGGISLLHLVAVVHRTRPSRPQVGVAPDWSPCWPARVTLNHRRRHSWRLH